MYCRDKRLIKPHDTINDWKMNKPIELNGGDSPGSSSGSSNTENKPIQQQQRIKQITVRNYEECQQAMKQVLRGGGNGTEEEIEILYSGSHSLEELIPGVLEFPSLEKYKEDIAKIKTSAKADSSKNNMKTYSNVIVTEGPWSSEEKTKQLKSQQQPPEEAIMSDELNTTDTENTLNEIINQLNAVEGCDTEEWGSELNTKSNQFYSSHDATFETDEEKERHFQEFLRSQSSDDDNNESGAATTGSSSDLQNEQGCSHHYSQHDTISSPVNGYDEQDQSAYEGAVYPDNIGDFPVENGTGVFEDQGPFSYDDHGLGFGSARIPDDVITHDYVLNLVLGDSLPCLNQTEIPPQPNSSSGSLPLLPSGANGENDSASSENLVIDTDAEASFSSGGLNATTSIAVDDGSDADSDDTVVVPRSTPTSNIALQQDPQLSDAAPVDEQPTTISEQHKSNELHPISLPIEESCPPVARSSVSDHQINKTKVKNCSVLLRRFSAEDISKYVATKTDFGCVRPVPNELIGNVANDRAETVNDNSLENCDTPAAPTNASLPTATVPNADVKRVASTESSEVNKSPSPNSKAAILRDKLREKFKMFKQRKIEMETLDNQKKKESPSHDDNEDSHLPEPLISKTETKKCPEEHNPASTCGKVMKISKSCSTEDTELKNIATEQKSAAVSKPTNADLPSTINLHLDQSGASANINPVEVITVDDEDETKTTLPIDLGLLESSTAPSDPRLRKRAKANSNASSTVILPPKKAKSEIVVVVSQPKLTQKQLLAKMKNEMKKHEPDLSVLRETLNLTFTARRKYGDSPNADVVAIVERYPALKVYQMVKEEFGRCVLKGDIKSMKELEAQLVSPLNNALTPKKRFTKRHEIWAKTLKYYSENKDCNENIKRVLSMIALSFTWTESATVTNLCHILEEGEDPSRIDETKLVTPTVVFKSSQLWDPDTEMWIYVEAEKYLKVPNFYEAVLCIYAIYYLFNLEYDKKLKYLFHYFDDFLGIPHST